MDSLTSAIKAWKRFYALACIIATIYYSIIQVHRYARNEDSSVISFKQLNQGPKDIYPDITICLEGNHFNVEINSSIRNFSNYLKGLAPINCSSICYLNDTEMHFNNLSNIISTASFKTAYDTSSIIKDSDVGTLNHDNLDKYFEVNYKDPEKICFTRSSKQDQSNGIIRLKDDMKINNIHFYTDKDESVVRIYVHYPGQFIRHMDLPSVEGRAKTFKSKKNDKMTLTISGITTLRRRSKSTEPCDNRDEMDDYQVIRSIIRDVGCRPSYWNSQFERYFDDQSIRICQNPEEYRNIYENINKLSQILSNITTPCNTMIVSMGVVSEPVKKEKVNYQMISIVYSTSQYQEIINVKDFDFDSMFSAMGGFVGIFLGHSLLQFGDMFDALKLRKFKNLLSK